jgi:hypothetical protein
MAKRINSKIYSDTLPSGLMDESPKRTLSQPTPKAPESNIFTADQLNVGDIIYDSRFGLMLLTLKRPGTESGLAFRLHGKSIFNMTPVMSDQNHSFVLHEVSVLEGRIRLATDEDIINALSDTLHQEQISSEVQLTIYPESRNIAIYHSGNGECLILDEAEILELKRILKQIY